MDLLSMVMEARKKRSNQREDNGINISDAPTDDEEYNDYTDDGEGDDAEDATPDNYGDEGDVISDEAPDEGDEANDYSEGDPYASDEDIPDNDEAEPANQDEQPADIPPEAQDTPPGNAGGEDGSVTISDQAPEGQDAQQQDAGGTDYGEGMPEGEGQDQQQPPEEGGEQQPPQGQEGGQAPPQEGGEEGAPPEEGQEDPNTPAEGGEGERPAEGPNVDEPEKNSESRKMANNILLLRSFNRLHLNIRKFAKRVAEAKHQSILGSVTYRQVVANLNELRDMVYKYILLSYDSSTYDENLANYYYFIEIMDWNLAMLEKVNDIVDKVNEKKKDK